MDAGIPKSTYGHDVVVRGPGSGEPGNAFPMPGVLWAACTLLPICRTLRAPPPEAQVCQSRETRHS